MIPYTHYYWVGVHLMYVLQGRYKGMSKEELTLQESLSELEASWFPSFVLLLEDLPFRTFTYTFT